VSRVKRSANQKRGDGEERSTEQREGTSYRFLRVVRNIESRTRVAKRCWKTVEKRGGIKKGWERSRRKGMGMAGVKRLRTSEVNREKDSEAGWGPTDGMGAQGIRERSGGQ